MSSDHLVRPTNADPRLIDLPLFGQPLPSTPAAAPPRLPAPPVASSYDDVDVDWGVVASLRTLASKQLSQAVSAESSPARKRSQSVSRTMYADATCAAIALATATSESLCV